jgi:uncharacterized protein (DUF362 family)
MIPHYVTPAQAGVQCRPTGKWIPAFAGMTFGAVLGHVLILLEALSFIVDRRLSCTRVGPATVSDSMSKVARVQFDDYESSIRRALDLIGAADALPREGLIIIKPNLTNSSPPPVTTDVRATEAVYQYCRDHTGARIVVGEGAGSGRTGDIYAALGYTDLAKRHGIELIDFNSVETVELSNPDALHWKTFHLPRIAMDAFIVSVPVLKDHDFSKTTIAMKNMFGLAPARYYANGWNKSKLHTPSTDDSIVDICLYKKPDLSVVDASVALQGGHLSGRKKHLGLILAGFDPVAVDAVGSQLLGHDPGWIHYLTAAEARLGSMQDINLLTA